MRPLTSGALTCFAFVLLAVAAGSLTYLVVSFSAMRRYTEPRPFSATLGSFLRESVAVALTQPLIPLFYLLGKRFGGARDGRPVILVHGYFQNRADFVFLAWALRRAGLGPLYGFNYDWSKGIGAAAARLGRFVEGVCQETSSPDVALVAHSLGGVVSLEYLASPAGAARVSRCVTIASPHAGVGWRVGMVGRSARELHRTSDYMRSSTARPLPKVVVSVFSTHDNIVHPEGTSSLAARGGSDVRVTGVGHLAMLFSREVADATIRALRS